MAGPRQRTDDAQGADRAGTDAMRDLMRQAGALGPMIPRPGMTESTRAALERADAAARPVVEQTLSWARAIEQRMPMDIGAARRQLGTLIPENEREGYHGQLEMLDHMMRDAERLQASGDARAAEALQHVRLALEGLGNTYHTATRAREAHLSDEVVGAVRSSFFDMGRGDTTEQRQVFQERSETTRRLAEFRIEHPVLASQDMTPAARAVDSWIVNLGTAATLTSGNAATDSRAAREQTQTVNQGFQQLRTLVNDVEASSRSIGISTLRDYSDQMLMMAAQIRDQTFREELQRTREAIRQMTERMEGDPAARVNEGEIQKLEAQIAFFINARDQILAGTEGTPDGQQLEAILGRGMRAIRENHADQAQVQLFIAGIYRDGSSSLKGELRAVSEGLANGTMTMEQATQRLGTYYTRELGTLAGTGRGAIQDQESRDMIGRITAGFSGRTLTVNDLARLAATYDIARDIKRHEDTYRNARGANRQAANEALGIYRSALHAIEIGAPIGAAAMQREFARKYMTADATMRENIRGMSARLETAENIRAMQGRLGDSTDPAQISAAARAVLGPGVGENDPRIAALVSAFNQAGHNAQERLAFVQGVETEANTFLQLMQRRDGIRTLLDQTVRQRLGERERQLYDRALGAIDGVLRSLGLGQQVSPTQLQSVQIQTIMLVGEPPLISAAFATSQDPQERQAQLQATDGLQSMTQIIRGIRDPVLRTQVAYIYGRGQEALAAGRVEEARSYFQLAQAAATTRSSEDRDRIFSITTRMQNVTEGQYVVTPEQASWFGRHFLDRAQMQARISDPAQRRTYNTYMDLALRMHIDGDENGSMFMFNLASMYGRAAALGGNDPQVRAALAIPQGNAELGIPSLQNLVQEFMPYRAGVTGTLDASHLIDEMEPRHAPAEGPALRTFAQSLGAGESDSATRIQRLALALVPMQLGVDQAEFARGSVDPAARASAARYSAERRRLEERLTRTTDPLERERLQREISVVDPTVLTQRQQRATSDYAEGVTLMTQAADLRRQSLDKTAQAAATTDTTERQRLQREAQDLNSRADGLAQRAGVLMQSAQGLRGTVEGTHRSITTVLYTNHRERGRIALDAAALDYIAASDEARRGEGPMSQGQMGIIGSRMQAAEGERRLGLFEVARQAQIQRQKGEMNQAIQRLHDQNVAARDRSTDTGQAGGTQVRLPNADEEGHPVQSGPPAYDYDGIERRIASARGMVGAERFPEAGRSMRGIGQVIQLNETRASIYRAYWSYLPGAGDIERSTGSLHYLDASRLGGLITTAIEDADAGRFDQSRGGLWNVQELFMVQSEQQRRWNYGVLIDNLAGGVDRDLSVADPGTPGYDPNNPRSFGYVPDEERRRDPRRYQAHLRNMQAIASTGLFGNLRRDREGAREDLRAAARAQRDSAAAIESSDDIINGPGGLREGLGDEMIAAAVSHDRRQTGLGRLAGPTYSQDRVSGFIERGDTQGLMNLLNRDTALRESVLSDLQSRGVITAAGATALRADIQAGGTLTSFQDRSVGWNYATMAAGRVQEFFDTVDDTTRFRSVDHMMRDAMRSNGIGLLGNALWASSHAGQVPGVLRRGGTIPNVGSSGFVIENAGDSVYDHWAFRTEGVNLDLIGSYRDLARAQLDIQQTSAQGTATVTIPELGDLRIPVIHQQAMNIADRETRLTFMLMGYDVDVRASTARHVELNQEQLQVVQEALQSVAMARGEYLTTGGTLKSWITSDDRQRVYETLDTQTAAAMRTVEDVVAGRGATGTDRRGNPQFVAADRDRYLQQITQGRTTMTTSVTQIRTAGAEQERYWNYGCAAAELVGAGLVSLIPGGQIVVAGYFLTRGIESFEETRVGAGGWEQMSTTQQVLGVGGIALGALGFVSAGGSLITREAALGLQEGMALSRPMLALSTATRVSGYVMIAGGVGMAGLTMYDLHEQGEQARRSGGHEPDWLDYGFQMFNAAQPFLLMGGQRIGMRYPSLMYSNGVGGYAFRGFMAVMGHSSAMASEEAYIGAIEAMSRARHQIMAQAPTALPHIEGSLGRSLDPHEVIALQQQFTVRGADGRSRISIPDPVAAAALIDSYSRHYDTRLSALSPDAHARLLTFQRELGFGPDVAMALMDHYGNGLTDVNMADVSRYVTRSGAAASREQSLLGRLNEEQRRGFGDLTQRLETSRGSPLRLDERVALLERFGTSVPDAAAAQSFLEGRRVMPDQTVTAGPYDIRQYESTQYARDLSEAAMRLNSLARNEAGVVMEGVSEIRRGGDGSVTYVVGQGENAVTVTQQQVSIAADTIQYAQRLMARGETPLAQAREQILGEIKAQLRNEGVPPAQVDAIAEARTQAVVRLAADPQFREATRTRPGPGVPSPMPRMLERALSVTDSVVQAEGQRRTQPLERARRAQVQGARTSVRDETILRSDVIFNTFDGMRTTEQGRREFLMGTGEGAVVYSQQHVALAQDFATYGDRLVNRGSRSLTDVASEIRSEIRQSLVRGGMDGTQADTVAAERSRAILRLATDAEFRSASQRGNPTDRGAMMRRALDASRDMVPQEARPRAAVPGRARPPPLPVTEEARSSFRGMRAELQDLGHQGTAHVEGEFRTTYMFGGRSFEMQQGQDAATSASAADNIVRRRAAGEDVTPQRARQIARDLGVPERLLDQTVALSENAQFRAAVEANSGEGRMRAALGMPPAEAPALAQPRTPQARQPLEVPAPTDREVQREVRNFDLYSQVRQRTPEFNEQPVERRMREILEQNPGMPMPEVARQAIIDVRTAARQAAQEHYRGQAVEPVAIDNLALMLDVYSRPEAGGASSRVNERGEQVTFFRVYVDGEGRVVGLGSGDSGNYGHNPRGTTEHLVEWNMTTGRLGVGEGAPAWLRALNGTIVPPELRPSAPGARPPPREGAPAAREQVRPQQLERQPVAEFSPQRFRETMAQEEASILADVDRLHAPPEEIRHVAEGRRATADEWVARADDAALHARRLEIEGASPAIVNDAYARAGRDERIAFEYRRSADRLDAEAGRREGAPQAERTPQALERDVGAIESNPALEAVIRSRGLPEGAARIARVLESIMPGSTELTSDQIRTWPEEYRNALERINQEEPQTRVNLIADIAREINYERQRAVMEPELRGRVERGEITQQVMDDAMLLHAAMNGGEVPISQISRLHPDAEPMRFLDGVMSRRGSGMAEPEALVEVARMMGAPAPAARRSRAAQAVEQQPIERLVSQDRVAEEILRRAGYRLENGQLVRTGPPRWSVGGEEMGGEVATTGRQVRAIEDVIRAQVAGGQEVDVIVVAGDKTKLNQINQLLGREHGDRTLDAYRGIFRRTMLRAAGEVEGGSAFLIRPSASGDETIAVIVVPRGEGQRVRESIQRNLTQITDEVVGRVTREGRSGGLYDVVGIVQDPRALIGAAVDVGTPVSIRRSGDGVSATRVDGSSGLITRPDGHVEFLAPQVRMAEEEGTLSFAPGLRQRMGVTADTEIRRAPNVADIQPTDTVTGIVFEIRLAVTDPSVLADMEGHLATTRKGLAEVETNRFGIRGLNTFLGHYGSNRVINEVEGAVGQFATQRGLTIRRLGTMKYEIEGGTAADYQALRTFIDDRLQASGMRFRSAEYVPPATVRGVPPDEALAQISNGHLRLEWGSQNYDTANALISSMAIGNDATLGRLLGGDHGLQPIIDLVRRNPSIRNMEDLMIALREPSIAGPNGPALRDAFTRFVEQSGGQFRRNLRELPEQMARDRAATAGPQERPISGPEVVVQVRQEAGRIEQLYERYQEARTETRAQGPDAWRSRFNASELETIDRVNATARRGGYGRTDQDMQRVFLQVADARVRRPAVELPQGFSGMPEERYSTRVPVVGGGEVPFGQAPRARLLSRLDSERSAEGTTAGVFRAEMIVDGQPTEAVVKVFRDPQPDSNHGIVSWDAQLAHAQREYQNLQILADLGIGPRPLGFVQVDGNIGIAMERVRGVHLDELTPADMRRVIRPETFRQLGEAWQRILNAGYGNEDFQFAILTQDQMINGVMRHAGDVVVWDAGGLQRTSELQAEFAARGQEYRPFTADQVVRAEQNTVDVTLMRDHLGSISGPRRDALRQFLEGVLSPADVSASHGDVAELSRRYIVRGREERAQAGGRFLSEMQDRMAARRLEVSLRAIESDSGVQLLPAREGGPGPGGGRREEGGGPQAQPPPVARLEPRAAQQSPRDMASSLISGQIVDVPPAMRDQVSVEAARQLFNNSEGQFVQRNMADLARRVALDERGVRPDAEAARQFALLPQDVQTQMRRLWTEDTRFIMAAQGSDATFQRHITTPRLGGRLMDEVGDHVRPRVVEEHAQPQVLRATGTDSAAPVVQEQPQGVIRQGEGGAREGPVGIARPGPVAMADQTRRGGPTGEGGGRPPVPREERQGGERGGRGGGGPRRERAAAPQQERSVTDVTGMQAAELPARVTFGREIVQEGRNFVEFTYDTGFGAGEERTRTIRIQAPEAQEGRAPGPAELRAHFERELGREITRIHEERRTALVTEERNAGGLSRRLGQLNDDIQNSRLTLDDAVARYPEYADALRSIHGVDPAQRPAEIARYAERIETERAAPDSSLDTRALHHIARDYIRAPADRLGFAGRPNEMAVGRLLGQDPAYRAAVARGDMPEAIRIAREYENLLDTVEQTTPTVTRGQHVDVVQNARQVIAIGDIHGDVYGMLDQLTRSGVLRDTRPDLPRYDSSVPLDQRYQLREIPEGTQIVFMGDLIDRGTTSPEVVDFVQRLQRQVRDAGSEVHVIRGNHEAIFLRFVDLFRNMSTADVQRAVADPTATFDFSHSLDGATLTIPDPSRPGQMRTVSYSDFLSEYGISSSSATLNDVGIAASNAGLGPTVAALIRRYGSWENAVREMSVPGGALDFMRSTRGAVIIDGNLFTHGGPVMSAHSVADMDAHFQGLFGDVHNHWAWNYQLGGSPGAALRQFAGRDDHSVDYVTRQGWHQRLETAEGRQWMRDMGIDHIYVGHDATDSITAISPRVTNLDARLSEAYGAHGGVLVIDPLERGPHVRVVTGRDEVPSAMRARQRDGIAARGTDVQDFTNGRQRTEVLRGNRISEAAQSFMEPQVTLGMRRGELPEGVEYAGMGTEARSGQRYAEFHMGMPRGETEIIVINAPPETMTAPQRRQYYQRELAREVHRLHEQRTRQLEDQERLIDLHGSTAPSPELGLRLPVGQDNIQIRGVARILEQIVNSSRDDASIRRDYPEYADAVQSIRGARGLSADDRAREIIERAHGILEERALSRASEAGVVRLVEGGGDLVTARRAMDRAVSEARRISRIEQGNPTEMMVVRLVNDAAAHSESPRAVVALEVLQGLAADGARIANSTPAQRQADPALALGYEVAMARARSEGRTTPSAEDRIFGAAAMQASGPMADIMLSYVQDINARAGQRAPEIVVQLAHTASFIFDRLPIGNPPSASDAGLVSGALDLASSLHMAGVRDAQSLFSNERGNGVLDLFPVTDASSHGRAIDAMRQLEAIAGSVPEHVTVTREQRGRTFQVEVPREQALETVLSYALDDARRLPPDARQTYLRSVRQGFAWNERVNERIGGMLVDNQGRATPASITDSRLPLIAYTFDDPTGILVASLDSSLIRNELRPNRIFRTVVDLVSSLQRARQQGHEADTAWVDLVRQKLEYMQSLESRGLSRKDRESAVKAFMREMLPQIQELYDNYVRSELQPTQLTQIARDLRGQDTREGFINTLGTAYTQMLPREMGITPEFAAANTELVLDLSAYRRDLERYTSAGTAPGVRNEQFAGYATWGDQRQPHMRGEAFDEVIPVMDAATRARAQGPEAFRDFKFSQEFHDELVRDHPRLLPDGRAQGEALFQTWRQDYRSTETVGGARYDISETGSFEDAVYGGRVRGELTCQDMRYGNMHVVGVVGTVELPWVRQMIVRNPDTGEIVYRRRLFLVQGDNGQPVLLMQPEYGARDMPGRAEVRDLITAQLRQRYEALGVEVRDMPNAALSIATPTTQYPQGVNAGYSTYSSGRSPFFYMDSNAWWIGVHSPDAGLTMGQNGLHSRQPGQQIHFGSGWSGRIDITRAVPGQQ